MKPNRSQIVCFPSKLTDKNYIRDFSFYTLYIRTYVPGRNRYQFWALAKAPTVPPTVYFNYGVLLCSCVAHNSIYVEFLAHQLFCHSSSYTGLKGKCLFPFSQKCEISRHFVMFTSFCELRLPIFVSRKRKSRKNLCFRQKFREVIKICANLFKLSGAFAQAFRRICSCLTHIFANTNICTKIFAETNIFRKTKVSQDIRNLCLFSQKCENCLCEYFCENTKNEHFCFNPSCVKTIGRAFSQLLLSPDAISVCMPRE